MTRPLTREQKAELLAALEERHRRTERRRVQVEREQIIANCSTLIGFIKEFWYVLEPARPFVSGWAIEAMCRHLEAVTRGDILRLLMTVPPGMMKSLLLVFWTAWEWGPKGLPHLQALATSYSQPNVLRDNLKLRRLVESEKFQSLWPLPLRDDQNAKGKFENVKNGFSEARPFGSMTGGRGDRVKIDDPHSTETAESEAERISTTRIFREGLSDRLNDVSTSAIVIIMQRLHTKDVAAVALELDIGFVHLNLPMEFEGEDPKFGGRCRTYVRGELFFEDPRTEVGELLFPERFPAVEVAKLKTAKGSYAWSGQYQQRPSPREGGMFKRHWFMIVDAVPAAANRKVRRWDLASSLPEPGTDPDYTVGLKMSASRDLFYIEDVIRFRDAGAKVRQAIKNTASSDGRNVKIVIPQDPGQAGKAQAASIIKENAGYRIAAERETGDKATRAAPLEAQCEAGNVYLLRGPWNEAFIDEMCSFPIGHDDQFDAAAGAFNELAKAKGPLVVSDAVLNRANQSGGMARR